MHQPVYEIEGTYLMPWARLHAVKDYLDMVLVLERFPKLKLNFDVAPALMDTVIDYAEGKHDIHSELTITDTETMNDEEKSFVLNNFFSPKFETMIFKSENYKNLYQKRFSTDKCNCEDFSAQEISDLMALFNLVWIDPIHFKRYPRLTELWEKQYNYTLEDRIEIINIHRQIISEIIPTYKKYIAEGRIEFTTTAYYHSILPILLDTKAVTKSANTLENLPQSLDMKEYARLQVKNALDRVEEVMGIRPKGFWPPELCLGPKTLNLLAKEGIEWTISDEGILSDSINFDFVRDFKGNLSDPYHLLKVYEYQTKTKPIDVIFRDRSIPNLINFEYAGIDAKMAAGDLYDKIKVIQNKLLVSPDETHLLTIALDGENCWENYQNDGNDFLENIYSAIENDDTLETVLISDYISKDKHKKTLNKIYSGSWIDKTFLYWIGDATKNKAWAYLKDAKDALEANKNHPNITAAQRELMIAQGSDWFWWYGEPNDSGRDNIFDFLFRTHLKNIYRYLDLDTPKHLDEPLSNISTSKPSKYPKSLITPNIDGKNVTDKDDIWNNAGFIEIPDGPVLRESKLFDKIRFGNDEDNFYLKFHLNRYIKENPDLTKKTYQMYIYMRKANHKQDLAPVRLINKTSNISPVSMEKFHNEIQIAIRNNKLQLLRVVKAIPGDMWVLEQAKQIETAYDEVLDLKIPFETLEIKNGETLEFLFINANYGIKDFYIPNEMVLSVTRPAMALKR